MAGRNDVDTPLVPVVLCGGSGTRLWPMSRGGSPKQFLPLVTAQTMFQETLRRTADLGVPTAPPIVVCHETHAATVAEQLAAVGQAAEAVLLEPAPRNTAPAVAAAALVARARHGAADPLMLVLPADHVVRDPPAFAAAVRAALEPARAGYLVTFGVVPDRPETGYGYISKGEGRGGWSLVDRFVEKPDLPTAEAYVASGRYLWNSGMFMFSASQYLAELERYAPQIVAACTKAVAADAGATTVSLGEAFCEATSTSVDYAVMEHTRRAAVVSLDAGWSDVGSWSALHDALDKDEHGNASAGRVMLDSCRDTYVAARSRLVAAIGLEGVVIVETPDAVLVLKKEHAQGVKRIVDALGNEERR